MILLRKKLIDLEKINTLNYILRRRLGTRSCVTVGAEKCVSVQKQSLSRKKQEMLEVSRGLRSEALARRQKHANGRCDPGGTGTLC